MVTRPAVLFADEPTGALDTHSARTVLALMRNMANNGQTIVMVTHDPVSASHADDIVFLRDGRIVERLAHSSAATIADQLTRLER